MKIEGKLLGERIAVRSYNRSDKDFVSKMWFDKENGRYLSDPEKEFIDDKFQRAVDNMEDSPLGYYFVAEMIETGELVGSCCAFPDYDEQNNLFYDIGYCVEKSHWRQGIGSEIVSVLLDRLKSENAKYVTAEVAKENAASAQLLKKFGFEVFKESTFKKYNMNISFDSYIFRKEVNF